MLGRPFIRSTGDLWPFCSRTALISSSTSFFLLFFHSFVYLLDTFSSSGTFCFQTDQDTVFPSFRAFVWTAHGSYSVAPIGHHSSYRCVGKDSIRPRSQCDQTYILQCSLWTGEKSPLGNFWNICLWRANIHCCTWCRNLCWSISHILELCISCSDWRLSLEGQSVQRDRSEHRSRGDSCPVC